MGLVPEHVFVNVDLHVIDLAASQLPVQVRTDQLLLLALTPGGFPEVQPGRSLHRLRGHSALELAFRVFVLHLVVFWKCRIKEQLLFIGLLGLLSIISQILKSTKNISPRNILARYLKISGIFS